MRRAVRHDDGFTLVELLVVVVILAILAGIAIPVYLNQRSRGVEAQVKAQVNNVVKATETLLADATGAVSGSSVAGTLTIGSASAAVATTDGVSWTVTGTGGQYCIASWADTGRYTVDAPLYYDSTVGRILPDGTSCADPVGGGGDGDDPGDGSDPGDDTGDEPTPEPEPARPFEDGPVREVRSVGDSGVFHEYTLTETPVSGGNTHVRLEVKFTKTEPDGAFTNVSTAQARLRCVNLDTHAITNGSSPSTLKDSYNRTYTNTTATFTTTTTCPAGTTVYDFTFSDATRDDPWWVSQEYLEINGAWPAAPADPYADKVEALTLEGGMVTRPARSIGNSGIMDQITFTVTETAKWTFRVTPTLRWTFIEEPYVGSTTDYALRCISPNGNLYEVPDSVVKNWAGNRSITTHVGAYKIDPVTCPQGFRPYDYITDKTDTSYVHTDPWWVSDAYIARNGVPPAVADPYLDSLPTLDDAQGTVTSATRDVDGKGTMSSINFVVEDKGDRVFSVRATMTWTGTSAGSTSGRFWLRCVSPTGKITTVANSSIVNSSGSYTIGSSGNYRVVEKKCPVGYAPYDYGESFSGDTTPVLADPWWVSNRYLQLNS